MADWYVSSAAWTAITQFAVSGVYTVGQIVRPLTAPAFTAQYAFRCTTPGTASTEPAWPAANNATVTTGGATFTNVTGQSAYGWGAAAGNLYSMGTASSNRPVIGDRVFVSSDHSETNSNNAIIYGFGAAGFGLIQIISVNRGGSVPPVSADITPGATIIHSGTSTFALDSLTDSLWQGMTFSLAGSSAFNFNSTGTKIGTFKNCTVTITSTSGALRVAASNPAKAFLDNTTVQFGATTQGIGGGSYPLEMIWINTPTAIVGSTIPAQLFFPSTTAALMTLRGVDISAVTGTLLGPAASGAARLLLDSCRIAPALTRYASGSLVAASVPTDEVELINCYDGTNVINERHTAAGDITTDRSTYLTSGAQDDIGNYSLKLASSSRNDFATFPLDCFAFDVENTVTGTSKTATVEIVSSGTLNNNDIRLLLEYMGTSGNPVASFGDSLASVLTAASALPASSNMWINPPATPQKQLLQVTFTPQRAGRVRGLVRLGKVSTTVWCDPRISIA